MVFHVSTIHVPYAVSCLHSAQGVNHSVVQGYKQRGWLEYRAWLQQVADGMVPYFPIFAVITLLQVDDGFHISRMHFHDDGYAHISVDFLQLLL